MDPERCDECDFDGSRFDSPALINELRTLGPRWRVLIESAGPDLRIRPAPEVWSAIEYAAHSRDITALHAFGVEQALTTDEPHYPEIEAADLVETAAESYADEQPATVVAALDEQAKQLATLADENGDAAWTRGLTIGSERTDVRRLLEHALHDSTHHLRDVELGLARIRAADA